MNKKGIDLLLMMALEHVRTLHSMAETEAKAKAQPNDPRAQGVGA